jgi:hypothetical protein
MFGLSPYFADSAEGRASDQMMSSTRPMEIYVDETVRGEIDVERLPMIEVDKNVFGSSLIYHINNSIPLVAHAAKDTVTMLNFGVRERRDEKFFTVEQRVLTVNVRPESPCLFLRRRRFKLQSSYFLTRLTFYFMCAWQVLPQASTHNSWIVDIGVSSFDVQAVYDEEQMPFVRFLADAFGYLSLFLGVSVITIVIGPSNVFFFGLVLTGGTSKRSSWSSSESDASSDVAGQHLRLAFGIAPMHRPLMDNTYRDNDMYFNEYDEADDVHSYDNVESYDDIPPNNIL